jgi:hypothetical protein
MFLAKNIMSSAAKHVRFGFTALLVAFHAFRDGVNAYVDAKTFGVFISDPAFVVGSVSLAIEFYKNLCTILEF